MNKCVQLKVYSFKISFLKKCMLVTVLLQCYSHGVFFEKGIYILEHLTEEYSFKFFHLFENSL